MDIVWAFSLKRKFIRCLKETRLRFEAFFKRPKSRGIYNLQECLIGYRFNKLCNDEAKKTEVLLRLLDKSIFQAGNMSNKQKRYESILSILSQTPPLLNTSLQLLSRGYIRAAECLIRVVSESILMAAYLAEFPHKETELRRIGFYQFVSKKKLRMEKCCN